MQITHQFRHYAYLFTQPRNYTMRLTLSIHILAHNCSSCTSVQQSRSDVVYLTRCCLCAEVVVKILNSCPGIINIHVHNSVIENINMFIVSLYSSIWANWWHTILTV